MADRYSRRHMDDRSDGRRLHGLTPVFQLVPFVVRHPADAVDSFTDQAELSAVEQWLPLHRRDGGEDVTVMHVFIAAYVRTLSQYPALNRFVSGRFLYARRHIDVILSTGGDGAPDAGSRTVKVRFLPTDNFFDVCRKINAQADSIKANEEAGRIERAAATLAKTPRFILRIGVGVLRWLDYHGWLSEGITDRSPFHGSAVISDEGASGLPPVIRSLNSIGAVPASLSVGRLRTAYELDAAGTVQERHYADYAFAFDGRIADSAYLGTAFRFFRHCLAHPDELAQTPAALVRDDL